MERTYRCDLLLLETSICQARVQVISMCTLKVSNFKVYLKSVRDLDLELDALIAMPPTTTHQ